MAETTVSKQATEGFVVVGDMVVVKWLDHFLYTREEEEPETEEEMDEWATTISVGRVRQIAKKWLVLEQNWQQDLALESSYDGIFIVRGAIEKIDLLTQHKEDEE